MINAHKLPDIKIEQVSPDKLIPYTNNARTHSDDQIAEIAASIKEFGFTNPILDQTVSRQADELTSEMIRAGVEVLRVQIGEERWVNGDPQVVEQIYTAMVQARRPAEQSVDI